MKRRSQTRSAKLERVFPPLCILSEIYNNQGQRESLLHFSVSLFSFMFCAYRTVVVNTFRNIPDPTVPSYGA